MKLTEKEMRAGFSPDLAKKVENLSCSEITELHALLKQDFRELRRYLKLSAAQRAAKQKETAQ